MYRHQDLTHEIVMFSDQIQIYLIRHGPKETTRGSVWNLFDPCHLRHFTDNLHFHYYVLEICEKDPCTTSWQDQKDNEEAWAIMKLALRSSAQQHCCFHSVLNL